MIDIAANPYKADFPLLAGRPDIAFLDSAATAQRPAVVLDAQKRFYETMNANPLRGLYSLSVAATAAIADVRAQVAALIGAPDARDVVFTRNTSESLNLVAKSFSPCVLGPGDEVAITIMEHHSNLIPWQEACRAAGATLVYLYMMLMACISFAMFIEAGYETSSRETLGRTMAVIYILLMIWLPFLVINCICFLFAVRDHNRTSAVRSNDFYKGLQVILLQIDEMNGVVAPKEKGTKTKFGKKGGKKGADGVLPIKETNAVDTQQDEKPKMKLRKREKKGGE